MIFHINRLSVPVILILTMLFTACGGGGDSTPPPSNGGGFFAFSPDDIKLAVNVNDVAPSPIKIIGSVHKEYPELTVQIIVENDVAILTSQPIFSKLRARVGLVTLNFISPNLLGVGTFTSKISVHVCTANTTDCKNSNLQLLGSPQLINVTYVIN